MLELGLEARIGIGRYCSVQNDVLKLGQMSSLMFILNTLEIKKCGAYFLKLHLMKKVAKIFIDLYYLIRSVGS